MNSSRPVRAAAVAAVAMSAFFTAACGDAPEGSDGPKNAGLDDLSSEAQARLDELYAGTSTSPATDGPKPEPGKQIWVISLGQSIESAQVYTKAWQDAVDSLGWDVKIVDGKFQPNLWLSGVEQAVAAGADGIILGAVDCAPVKTGLEAAKEAGIPVVGLESQDCEPSLESVISYAEGSFEEFYTQLGKDAALALVAEGGTSAKFIELRETDLQVTLNMSTGYLDGLDEYCPDCESVPVEFTGADLGPALQQKVQQTLNANPDAVGMFGSYDDIVLSGASSAILSANRAKDLYVVATPGNSSAMNLIRDERGLSADLVFDGGWEAYATIDWMNRLLNGETPDASNAPTGIGYQLIDADHGLPETGTASSTVDYVEAYEQSWGVGE
jgi:ribose transport system substrate-binding protein